jgi:hypothetical protein
MREVHAKLSPRSLTVKNPAGMDVVNYGKEYKDARSTEI